MKHFSVVLMVWNRVNLLMMLGFTSFSFQSAENNKMFYSIFFLSWCREHYTECLGVWKSSAKREFPLHSGVNEECCFISSLIKNENAAHTFTLFSFIWKWDSVLNFGRKSGERDTLVRYYFYVLFNKADAEQQCLWCARFIHLPARRGRQEYKSTGKSYVWIEFKNQMLALSRRCEQRQWGWKRRRENENSCVCM